MIATITATSRTPQSIPPTTPNMAEFPLKCPLLSSSLSSSWAVVEVTEPAEVVEGMAVGMAYFLVVVDIVGTALG